MTPREKALLELKKKIKEQRGRIDPKLLELAGKAASLSHEGKAGKDMVPYDRKTAAKAVELFLRGKKDDRAEFEERLMALIRKKMN